MTWHSILSAFQTGGATTDEPPTDESPAGVFSYHDDAGFGLPLVSSLLSEDLFDIPVPLPELLGHSEDVARNDP
ncbi:MAG: hypothetical protein SFU86_11275 [Pirellulaceae bacterium]|nr:hypothetical protein [Pirellulaceae bacterium]